jgi:hypothetical protein
MRWWMSLFPLAPAVAAIAQPSGTFQEVPWRVSESRALIWNGTPYYPAGVRAPGTPTTIQALAQAGVEDALLEVSGENWNEAIESAEKSGLRYLITPKEGLRGVPAFIVKPGCYRLEKVARDGEYTIPVPYGVSVYYVVLRQQDYAIAARGWVDVVQQEAKLKLSLRYAPEGYMVLFYPRVQQSELPDWWEGFSAFRDSLLYSLRQSPFGKGFRGLVSPLGSISYSIPEGIVPDSELFRLEFAAYLKGKYRDVDKLISAWNLTAGRLSSFEQASRLVALFSQGRGTDYLWDPLNDTLFPVLAKGERYWDDLRAALHEASARRTRRLAEAIRRVIDVPVILEWRGWSLVYDTATPAGDGIGLRVGSDKEDMARTASTVLSWNHRGWFLATEVPGKNREDLLAVLEQTAELGVKGWFVRWSPEMDWKEVSSILKTLTSQAAWLSRVPRALFYPEGVRNPTFTTKLPGDVWWLPSPASGERLDLGDEYAGYRINAPYANMVVLWRTKSEARVRFRLPQASSVKVLHPDGSPLPIRARKDSLEFTLGTVPVVLLGAEESPAPEDVIQKVEADFADLERLARERGLDISEQRFVFADARRKLSRSPGESLRTMLDKLREVHKKLGSLIWIEGEQFEETNFSYVEENGSCSQGKQLVLETPLRPTQGDYFAKYRVRIPWEGDYEVWVAGSIDSALPTHLYVEISGLKLYFPNAPHAPYGSHSHWYRLGTVTFKRGGYDIFLRASPEGVGQGEWLTFRLDALILAPLGYVPSAPRYPLPEARRR